MLVVEFIELKLKEYQHLLSFDLKNTTWEVLKVLKKDHEIMYNHRTLDMQPQELDKVTHAIRKQILKTSRL